MFQSKQKWQQLEQRRTNVTNVMLMLLLKAQLLRLDINQRCCYFHVFFNCCVILLMLSTHLLVFVIINILRIGHIHFVPVHNLGLTTIIIIGYSFGFIKHIVYPYP